jgi:putative transposase
MLEAAEAHFGGPRAMSLLKMLTDNGFAHAARETRIFARQLSLTPYFTPVRSLQSNGTSETFVHTPNEITSASHRDATHIAR